MRFNLPVVCGAVLVAAGSIAPFLLRLRKDPKERERRRRDLISMRGRVIEGFAIDSTEAVVLYTYHWRGVRYEASQDISDFVAAGTQPPAGSVTVKFLRDTPANSIIISENWSGIPELQRTLRPRESGA